MKLSDFDFHVPRELIAQKPLRNRSGSRLLVYERKSRKIHHCCFVDIIHFLGKDDVLVINDSKVLPARIQFEQKEIFLIEVVDTAKNIWKCMVRKGKSFQVYDCFSFEDGTVAKVVKIDRKTGFRNIEFVSPDFRKFLKLFGQMPTPPYIEQMLKNQRRYQTIYAKKPGSVAAPTAGLHFTSGLLEKMKSNGVQVECITLHVGPGTFLPVKAKNIADHKMHSECFEIQSNVAERLNEAKLRGKKVTAVGSTSLRTLESCADTNGKIVPKTDTTQLFMYPPEKFHFADHLLTNFHLPKSTLLMLVAAFLTPETTQGLVKVHEIYQEAVRNKYRFFSFGDAMLIL